MDEYQDWWDAPFEPTQFDSWSWEDRNYNNIYHDEEDE